MAFRWLRELAAMLQHSLPNGKMLRISPSSAILFCVSGICLDVKNCIDVDAKEASVSSQIRQSGTVIPKLPFDITGLLM